MKKTISLKWLTLSVLSLIFCLSLAFTALNFSTAKSVKAENPNVVTSTEIGINGKTPIAYSEFVTNSGVSVDGADIGFVMEKGALVRGSVTTPGVKYVANLGAGIDTIKAAATYTSATFDFYVLFEADEKYLFVKADLVPNGANYQIAAAITFDGVEEVNFADYKAKEITGQGVMVVTNGADKTVVLAEANDNTRTMEAVVNTAKNVGALDVFSEDVKTELDKYVPGYSVSTDGLYADRVNSTLDYAEIIGIETDAKAVYVNTAKVDDTYAMALADTGAAGGRTAVSFAENEYVTVVDKDGNFTNYNTVTVADQILRTAADLPKLYGNDGTKKLTTTGYFLVANDIAYDPNVTIAPYNGTGSLSGTDQGIGKESTFSGKFDGNGKTIEYALTQKGLFGYAANAQIFDAAFIVKAIPETLSNQMAATGQLSILGGYGSNCTVYDIYAKYDCEVNVNLVSHRFVSPGLFAYTNSRYFVYNNVVLDLTNVTIGEIPSVPNNKFSYGVIWSPMSNANYYVGTATNVHVIWNNKNLSLENTAGNASIMAYGISENDKTAGYTGPESFSYWNDIVAERNDISTGITRYDNVAAMLNGEASVKVAGWTISADGATWNR